MHAQRLHTYTGHPLHSAFAHTQSNAHCSEATSWRAQIRTAKGVVKDIGESASKSGGLREFASISEKNSERDGQRLCKRLKLALPVEMSTLQKAPGVRYAGEICVLKLESWIRFILDINAWHIFCGLQSADEARERAILTRFWRYYREYEPQHAMWALVDQQKIDLSRCAPLLFHGDEGRGRKRCPFLVLSWSCVLGFGTTLANKLRKAKSYTGMGLNYSGSTHLHRLLTGVLPKMTHDDAALQDLLRCASYSAVKLMTEGITNSKGHTFFAVTLHCTGDWAWIVKAGNLARGFGNIIKRPMNANTQPKGFCHICRAGQRGVPFENFRNYQGDEVPAWHPTMFQEPAFTTPPELSRIPYIPGKEPAFYAYDLFHAYHLGLGKCFVAGVLAVASDFIEAGTIDGRFEQLTYEYLDWCDRAHRSSFLNYLTKENIGWPDRGSFPNGQWSKGHVTTALSDFFTDWASSKLRAVQDDYLQLCLEANVYIQKALHDLYAHDVWLDARTASSIAQNGILFLDAYRRLSTTAYHSNRCLFPHMPKSHAVEHIFWQLRASSLTSRYCMSPLVVSVQISEDFVGKCSRLARRVSPLQAVKRVLERSLQASHKHWKAAEWIRS